MSKVDQKHPDLQPKSRNNRNLTLNDIWHVVRCHPAASVLILTIAICHKTQLMTGWPFAKTRSTSTAPKALLFANNNCPVSRPSTNQRKDPAGSLRQRWLDRTVQKHSGSYHSNTNATHVHTQFALAMSNCQSITIDSKRPPLCAITSAGGATANIADLVPFPALGTQ